MSPSIFVQLGIYYVPVVLVFCASLVSGDLWRTTTACYGADPSCSSYKLECRQGENIVLGDLKYGTKPYATSCLYGVSDCATQEKKCCTYDGKDQFRDFGVENRTNIKKNCEGKMSCIGMAPRLFYSPYSSYVLIRYACVVGDRNVVNMCSENKIAGNEVFLSYKKGSYEISNTTTSTDCTCLVTQKYCRSYLDITVVDMDFYRPGTKQPNCSNAYMIDTAIGGTLRCLSPGAAGTMQKHTVYGNGDMVSIHGLYRDDIYDRPNNIVIYYNSAQPFTVECFRPGSKVNQHNQCSTTLAPSTRTFPISKRTMSLKQYSASGLSSTDTHSSDSTKSDATTAISIYSRVDSTSPFASSKTTKQASLYGSSKSVPNTPITQTIKAVTLDTFKTKASLISSIRTPSQTNKSAKSTMPVSKSTAPKSSSVTTLPSSSKAKTKTSYAMTSDYYSSTTSDLLGTSTTSVITTSTKNSSSQTSKSSPSKHSTSSLKQNSNSQTNGYSVSKVQNSLSPTISELLTQLSHRPRTQSSGLTLTTNNTASTMSLRPTRVSGSPSNASGTIVTAASSDVITPSTRSSRTTKGVSIDNNDDDGGNNKGLIIGLSVAALLLVGIIALVVVMCFCFKLKRNEKERRNYIQNTNIFYSFPEDPEDGVSTEFESQHTDLTKTGPLPLHFANPDFKRNGNTANTSNSTIHLDDYKIQASSISDSNDNLVGVVSGNSLTGEGNGRGYSADRGDETVNFVNGTESNNIYATIDKDRSTNGGKTVSFDTSVVKPEGKTKF